MTSIVQIQRRINGPAGSPSATGAKEGELALNFPKAAGSTDKPELWAYDGVAYRQVNPDVTVNVGTAALTSTGAAGSSTGIGAAWTALTPKPTGSITIATYGGTAYVKTGAGAADGDWTALGSATAFASAAEIHAGTDTAKAINSATLRGETRNAANATPANDADYIPRLGANGRLADGFIPKATDAEVLAGTLDTNFITPQHLQSRITNAPNATPATDARKLVMLDSTGKIAAGFLPAGALNFAGAFDLTVAKPATLAPVPKAGDMFTVSKTGTMEASWAATMATLTAGAAVTQGDMLIWDDVAKKFHHIANVVDTSGFVSKAGTSVMAADAKLNFATTPPVAGATILDGGANHPIVDNVTINCGTY